MRVDIGFQALHPPERGREVDVLSLCDDCGHDGPAA